MTPSAVAGPAHDEPMLRLRDVEVTFNRGRVNETAALRGVTLAIPRGQFVVIVGSNGAGKSTLMNVVAGLHLADRGTIELGGHDVARVPDHRRARRIGRVFQDPLGGTAGALTIHENLVLAERRAARRRFRIPRNAQRHRDRLAVLGMGLEDRLSTRVDSLSGGQRQALAVLMAMQGGPDLLMLDEHTAALDPAAAERVLDVTRRLTAETGITTMMITHNMSHAVDFGERTVMMHRGRVLFDVQGTERAALGRTELIDRFRALATDDEFSDRTVLS
jgi:putative tryptophan/tyrosine transport system ATP-binding protein